MKELMWVLTILGVVAGGITMADGLLSATSAPQQGAAAVAVGFVVIPYCLARAVEGLSTSSTDRELKTLNEQIATHTRMLASLANATGTDKMDETANTAG